MITNKTVNLMLAFGLFALVAIVFMLPADAFAGGGGATNAMAVNSQASNLSKSILNIPKLLAVGCYVIGSFFGVRALFALKGFIESPDDNPITKVLGFACIGALLIVLPYIITVTTKTIVTDDTGTVAGYQAKFNDQGF